MTRPTSADETHDSSVIEYLAVLRRRAAIVLALTIAVPVVALVLSLLQENTYKASTSVLLSRQSVANQLSGSADVGLQQQSFQQLLTTQAKLARSPKVLGKAVANAAAASPPTVVQVSDLRSRSTAEAEPNSDLLVFSVESSDPRESERLSLAYAQAYVSYRSSLDTSALSAAIADVDQAIRDASRSPRDARLRSSLATTRQQLETRRALQTANAQVVSKPEPATKVRPTPVRNVILGLVLGLMAGLLLALLREATDTRVRSSDASSQILGVPTLGRLGPPPRDGGDAVAMLTNPGDPSAEAVRLLRTNLEFSLAASDVTVLMVTSATQSEGKSTTIANLGVAEALAGKRVALVDLDLRRPTLHRLLGVPGDKGVTDIVLGTTELTDALIPLDLPAPAAQSPERIGSLSLLPSGTIPPNPSEFVASARVGEMLEKLSEAFDLVLIDAPPIVVVSDASLIAQHADAVFLCVRLGATRRAMLRDLHAAIERLDRPALGQVVTGDDVLTDGGYRHYYYAYTSS